MPFTRQLFDKKAYEVEEFQFLDYQTTGNTPSIIHSFSTDDDKGYVYEIKGTARETSGTKQGYLQFYQAIFSRPPGGNITLDGENTTFKINPFAGIAPDIKLLANAGTNQIDLQIKGTVGRTLNWIIRLERKFRR